MKLENSTIKPPNLNIDFAFFGVENPNFEFLNSRFTDSIFISTVRFIWLKICRLISDELSVYNLDVYVYISEKNDVENHFWENNKSSTTTIYKKYHNLRNEKVQS